MIDAPSAVPALSIRQKNGIRILVLASSPQRIMTMVPVVGALTKAGFRAILCFQPGIGERIDRQALLSGLECRVLDREEIAKLTDIDVFVSSDTAIGAGPRGAIRVAIFHSLPDRDLTFNYASIFRRTPQIGALTDYFCIAVRQSPKHWTVKTYSRLVDRVFPRQILHQRREDLTIVPLGYPKIDMLMNRRGPEPTLDTITYAPTQTTLASSSVRRAGAGIIAQLLENFPDHRIVFRPYPGPDATRLRGMIARFDAHPRFTLDTSLTGDDLMMRSAVVVTDRSSMAVSYSLGLARPSVFFAVDGLGGRKPASVHHLDPIGFRAGSVRAVPRAVARALRESERIGRRIAATRGDYIHNPGTAATYLADIMPDIVAGHPRADWLRVPRRPLESRQSDKKTGKTGPLLRLRKRLKVRRRLARLMGRLGS